MKADVVTTSLKARLADGAALLCMTLWVGSLWGVGFLAVPVLFQAQPDKMLAGMLAGQMFTLVAYLGIACASYLLSHMAVRFGGKAPRQPAFLLAAAMLLLVLVSQFGIQPEMAALKAQALPDDVMHSAYAARFDTLHHVASGLYVAKALLGAALVICSKTLLIFRPA
jgi:hypothetical protein